SAAGIKYKETIVTEDIGDKKQIQENKTDCERDLRDKILAITVNEKEKTALEKEISYLEKIGNVFIEHKNAKNTLNSLEEKYNIRNVELNNINTSITNIKPDLSEIKSYAKELDKKHTEIVNEKQEMGKQFEKMKAYWDKHVQN
ncbi:hypothetical protein MCHI_003297, partial [Candidatus Magnetoovum chiemensis]